MRFVFFTLHRKAFCKSALHCADRPFDSELLFLPPLRISLSKAHWRPIMPLLTTLATTAFLLTLGGILYCQVRAPHHEELIADIERQIRRRLRNIGCHKVVIVEPSNGDGIWSASVYWTADEEEKVLQAFATTEREGLIRLRRIVRRAFRVASLDGEADSEL